MKGGSGFLSVALAVGLAASVLVWTPNCALARDDQPAYTLPGPHCVWTFFNWLWGSDDSSDSDDDGGWEDDEGERLFDEYFGPW